MRETMEILMVAAMVAVAAFMMRGALFMMAAHVAVDAGLMPEAMGGFE